MNARQMDPARYGYAQIKSALALVFGADAKAQKGWLRGRIQNLKKLGLSPPSPGPGRAISYFLDDADKWLLGLEFGFLHIDPSTTADFIQAHWTGTLKTLIGEARESRPDADVILTVRFAPTMSKTPDIGRTTMRGLDAVGHWLREQLIGVSIFNLSALVRAFDKALIEPPKPAPPETTHPTAGAIVAAHRKQRGDT